MKIKKATKEEKDNYCGEYPLHGFVIIDSYMCSIEDKKAYFGELSDGECRYEVVAPDGFYFEPYGTHTVLCESISHVKEVALSSYVLSGATE